MGHRFMYELGLALGFIACVIIFLKYLGTEAIHAIFPPKDDKETKTVTEVQESEKQEDPYTSTATDDTFSTTTGDEPTQYTDTVTSATTPDGTTSSQEEEPSLPDIDTSSGERPISEDTADAFNAVINDANDEAVDAQIEQKGTALAADMLRITMDYATEHSEYLTAMGISSEDVLNCSSAIIDGASNSEDSSNVIDNPEYPGRSVMGIATYDGVEIYRMTLTVNDTGSIDVDMILNESNFVETLDKAVEQLVYERNQ